MFSQVEDLLPVISFGSKKDSETEKKHSEFVERCVARLYGTASSQACGMVHAREASWLGEPCTSSIGVATQAARVLGNRQRFIRRARALVRHAVREVSKDRKVTDAGRGGEITVPAGGIHEPSLRRSAKGGIREYLLPGNKQYIEGDTIELGCCPVAGRAAPARTGRARTSSASSFPTTSSSTCSSKIWSCRTSPSAR